MFVDAGWRDDFLIVETVYFGSLGLALEDGDASAFVEVLLDELGDDVFLLFGGQPGRRISFGASTDDLLCLCGDAVLLRLLAPTHHT